MRVLGIDPGLRIAGYAVVDFAPSARDPRLVEAGVIRLRAKEPVSTRLAQLHAELRELIEQFRPTHLSVEEVFVHVKHVRTAIVMGHGRGVVLLAGAEAGLAIEELSPTEIKKALTGRGQASKAQVQRAVMHQFRLATMPEPPDVADAIGIATTAARRLATASIEHAPTHA
ncbi:MAG: crossover junction endodeoxyribonuclease RuvC [Phycisphaerae bacterium]|nr:crossover junction endodeoxyribonuclease RuvC [Phycisphaerae bacterium]